MQQLSLPVLDAAFWELAPLCEVLRGAPAADCILNKLRLCSERGLLQARPFRPPCISAPAWLRQHNATCECYG